MKTQLLRRLRGESKDDTCPKQVPEHSSEEIEGARFMRGLLLAIALSLPFWALIIIAIVILV